MAPADRHRDGASGDKHIIHLLMLFNRREQRNCVFYS